MKKIASLLTALLAFLATSCATNTFIERFAYKYDYHMLEIPEEPLLAYKKINEHERTGSYVYTFTAVNYKDKEYEFKIIDDKYIKMTDPETGSFSYFYYKIEGDYLIDRRRNGIFANTAAITSLDEVYELVFSYHYPESYKFKYIYDSMKHDERWKNHRILWKKYSEECYPENSYIYDFFKNQTVQKFYFSLKQRTTWKYTYKKDGDEKQNLQKAS